MMYKSQLKQMDPYDCFCGPGSKIDLNFTNNKIIYNKIKCIFTYTCKKINFIDL